MEKFKAKTNNEIYLVNLHNKVKSEKNALETQIKSMQCEIEKLQLQLKTFLDSGKREESKNEKPPEDVEFLTDEEELAKETEWIRVKHRKKRKLNTSPSPQKETVAVEKSTASERKQKLYKPPPPPPIIVEEVKEYLTFYDNLSKLVPIETFKIKMLHGNCAKINASNEETYKIITSNLNENKYLWHSYENKQLRPIRVMAKKLHFTCKPERIVEDLQNKGLKIIEAVNKLRWKTKEPLNMFVLSFENGEDINKIYAIDSILACKVEIHPLKSSKLIPQCKRCQSYGHTKKYCSKEARCVKCAGKHLTKDCQKAALEKPKCIHCGESHPANYRGCIVAKKMQELRKKNRTNSQSQQKYTLTSKTSTTDVKSLQKSQTRQAPYADALKKGITEVHLSENNIESKLNQILNLVLTFDKRLKKLENYNKQND